MDKEEPELGGIDLATITSAYQKNCPNIVKTIHRTPDQTCTSGKNNGFKVWDHSGPGSSRYLLPTPAS